MRHTRAQVDRGDGSTLSLGQSGILMFTIVIITVHAQLASVVDQWTWMHHASCWGSVGKEEGEVWCVCSIVGIQVGQVHHSARITHTRGFAMRALQLHHSCSPAPIAHPAALWFLFLLAFGALPIGLSSDLHRAFTGTAGNAVFFWMTVAVVTMMCVLPTFGLRQLRRYLWPEYYQVVQEIAARERRGEVVLDGDRRCQLTGVMARASRLMQRKALKSSTGGGGLGGGACVGGGVGLANGATMTVLRKRYSGFVAPYEARSRVFDSNELFASAAAAGYTISQTGEIMAPSPTHRRTHSHMGGGGTVELLGTVGSGGFGAAMPASPAALPARTSIFGSGALARALSGIGAGSLHRRTASSGPVCSLGPGWSGQLQGLTPGGSGNLAGPAAAAMAAAAPAAQADNQPADAAAAAPPNSAVTTLQRSTTLPAVSGDGSEAGQAQALPFSPLSVGTSVGCATMLLASGTEAVPQVARDESTYASNPVLAQLEREFSRDPWRHKHVRKLSVLNVSNLQR